MRRAIRGDLYVGVHAARQRVWFCCPECGCTDIQMTAWVWVNTGKPTNDEGPDDDCYCPQCGDFDGEGHFRMWDDRRSEQPYTDDVDTATLRARYSNRRRRA